MSQLNLQNAKVVKRPRHIEGPGHDPFAVVDIHDGQGFTVSLFVDDLDLVIVGQQLIDAGVTLMAMGANRHPASITE